MHAESVSRRTALITGASAGIGEAFARVFAEHGFDLILTARREDRLQTLAHEISGRHGIRVHVVAADLAEPGAPSRIFDELSAAGLHVDALVNNAGYGLPGKYVDSPWERHAEFLQVMIVAVAELTRRALPGMIARGTGWIINVASLAGLVPATAGHTLYGASKALLIRFSESLAAEVAASGVHVTALCPGFTYSEFHDVNGLRPVVSQMPGFMWLDAGTVARQGFDAVMRGQPVVVTGRVNRAIAFLAHYAPAWLVNLAMRRQAHRYRRSSP